MPDQNPIIAATVQVDTGNSNETLKGFNKEIKNTKESLKDTGATALNTGEQIKGAGGHFTKLKDQMSALPGPLGQAGEGVGKLNTAFKALLANPVGLVLAAIVAVLALLYKAFTNTFAGGEKVEQIFAAIKAAAQALLDNLDKIGSAIVKVFSFDFSGAISDIHDVIQATADAAGKMAQLTRDAQGLKKEQLQNDLDSAKRAKDLAILREQAGDDSVSPAKRKAALKELQAIAQQNAKDDIDLAKRTAENKIAIASLEKDGDKKNLEEVTKAKIEQINVETQNANELRRINKQVTAAEKQEAAERKANAQAAAAAAKAERQKLLEFNNKLLSLQQENEISQLQAGYDRELKQLENKIANEKRANDLAFRDKKITREQQAQLDTALDIQLGLQKDALDKKHQEETAKKEVDFQKELAAIRGKAALSSITDAREVERVQLNLGYEEKLADAIARYQSDQVKFQEIKNALDEQLRAEQAKIELKFQLEDDKKKLELDLQKQDKIIADKALAEAERLAAVDAEQALVQAAFDNKILSELDYNTKVAALSEARKTIREQEAEHNNRVAAAIGDAFATLSEIAGKQTVAGKALAIASTTIKTYQSAVAAFQGMVSSIPGPVGIALGAVAAAGAIATGIATVKKIVAVQVPGGGGGGGGSVPTGIQTPAAPVAPTQSSTKIDSSSIEQINNQSARVYMVEADGASARERQERLRRAAVLGG